ncbi:hypothetical protein BOX15_Mlig021248g6 [Macrostomum lignano]|uniref:Uncharacterized protein n=1 Tax=Macrostomum lignano TaxID=282301 RepID=A0A267DNS0_9PLAT|nr:hypothetical protein BOX15_Mlig021248g6 [Macrostomum lignano]
MPSEFESAAFVAKARTLCLHKDRVDSMSAVAPLPGQSQIAVFWQRWSRSATVKSLTASKFRFARHLLLVAALVAGLAGRDWHWDSGPQLPLGLLTLEFLFSSALWSVWRRLLLGAANRRWRCRGSTVGCLTPVRVQRRFRLLAVLLLTAPAQTAAVSVVDDVNCGGDSVAEADSDADDSAENRRGGGQADRQLRLSRRALQAAAADAAGILDQGGGGLQQPSVSQERPGSDPLNLLTDLAGEPRAPRPTPAAFSSVAGLTAS